MHDFNNSLKLSWLRRSMTMDGGLQNNVEWSLKINKKMTLEFDNH